ncbi:MAG: nuclear transport factor 2 family protein [Solirubrobacterales bacterium]|nr:nuclear transport factor 2 family protein [Solirubrobacterales bacterium]HMT04406.1 nuclear transport factor 2 family protein [Solirubrobacterales bacterium]
MSEEFAESMKRSVAAMNEGDKEGWALEMHEEIRVMPVPGWHEPGPFSGIDDSWDFFRRIDEVFLEAGPVEIVEMISDGDRAVASVSRMVRVEGQPDEIETVVHMALLLEDGKTIENANFLDRSQALAHAGLR